MDTIEKIYNNEIANLLKGVKNSQIPATNPIIAKALNDIPVDTYAKLATLSIDASMRFLDQIGESNVSYQNILIGDLVSAYFYKCATLNQDLQFLNVMTQAISKQNELKQTLHHEIDIDKETLIKDIESIFIITMIDYYNIDLNKDQIKEEIFAHYN